jgi:hypothetical protein
MAPLMRYANSDDGAADTEPGHPAISAGIADRGQQRDLETYHAF